VLVTLHHQIKSSSLVAQLFLEGVRLFLILFFWLLQAVKAVSYHHQKILFLLAELV
jgi:hypothetical protein